MFTTHVTKKPATLRHSLPTHALVSTLLFSQLALADTTADIDQEGGTTNLAEIVQIDTTNALAHILQDGHSNLAAIQQMGPSLGLMSAEITQYGTENDANIEQDAIEDEATGYIIQGGTANVAEGIQFGARDIHFSIEQSGEMNFASVYQNRQHGNVDVTQVGQDNFAQVEQTGGLYIDTASVYQEGTQNSITILQEEENAGTIISHQIGNNNSAEVQQRVSTVPVGVEAILTTEGNNNFVVLNQDNAWLSSFNLTQTGDGNIVDVEQGGEGANTNVVSLSSNFNSDTVVQNVLGSNITIERHSTNNSTTYVYTHGFDDIYVEQNDSESVSATVINEATFNGDLTIRQLSSNDSTALITFRATEGSARIEQSNVSTSSATAAMDRGDSFDDNMISAIYQSDGADLVAAIEQGGLVNEALITQAGTSLSEAYIFQTGDMTYAEITQTDGEMNNAVITQSGAGYSAAIHQAGSDNLATIVQM